MELNNKLNQTRFEVFLSDNLFKKLQEYSKKTNIPISQIIRQALWRSKNLKIPDNLTRPRKFSETMHRFPICMHGDDKQLWKIRMVAKRCEFGSYVRYILGLFQNNISLLFRRIKHIAECKRLKMIIRPWKKNNAKGYQLIAKIHPTQKRKKPIKLNDT